MTRSMIICATLLFLATTTSAQGFSVFAEHDVFFSEQTGPYVELNLMIAGWDTTTVPGDLQIVTLAMQDTVIVAFKKTILQREANVEAVSRLHQERLALPAGRYEIVVEVAKQGVDPTKLAQIEKELIVPTVGEDLWLSDIMLAETIEPSSQETDSRNGYRIVPFVSTYYGRGQDALNFYAEIHQANVQLGDSSDYLVTFEIQEFETGRTFGQFKRHKRMKASSMEAVIASFDISSLPSGNYRLNLSCTNRDGEPIAAVDQFFQRNNPSLDPVIGEEMAVGEIPVDTLYGYLLSLHPISDELESKMISDLSESTDRARMESIFTSFWTTRDPDNPWGSWARYHAEVIKVNKIYGTRVKFGYETDRGYVHLKFGAPNSITDRAHDMNAYPYQIWHYYRAGKYSNKRFVFYLPDLVTNDYRLIHSEVPGEVQDPRWNQTIHSRNNPREDVMGEDPGSQSAGRARELFDLAP